MGDQATLRTKDFEILDFADSAYVVKLNDLGAGDRLALYSSGRLFCYEID
jgi:hypothetical protein